MNHVSVSQRVNSNGRPGGGRWSASEGIEQNPEHQALTPACAELAVGPQLARQQDEGNDRARLVIPIDGPNIDAATKVMQWLRGESGNHVGFLSGPVP